MSNYRVGMRFELRVRDYFQTGNWFVIRSAGSRSPIDLVAFKGGGVALVQCKTDGVMSNAERAQLQELARETGCRVYLFSRFGRKMISEEIKEEE